MPVRPTGRWRRAARRRGPWLRPVAVVALVVMRLLLLVRLDRVPVALGVGGQLQEHLLESGTVRGAQLDEGDASRWAMCPTRLGVGVDAERGRLAGAPVSSAVVREASAVRALRQPLGMPGGDLRAGGGQQVGLGAGGDDAAVADDDQVVGDDLDLVQQVRGQQHGGAAVGVAAQQVRIQRMPAGSRPLAGSSRMSTAGSPRSAWASPSRCRMPSE